MLIAQAATCITYNRHTVGLLCASDMLIKQVATCKTHNKHNRRKSLPSAGLETKIPAIERPQTSALDLTDTVIGFVLICLLYSFCAWIKFRYNLQNSGFKLQIKVEAVHPVVYDEYINIYYRQNTTITVIISMQAFIHK
jgi:hypothetical protein